MNKKGLLSYPAMLTSTHKLSKNFKPLFLQNETDSLCKNELKLTTDSLITVVLKILYSDLLITYWAIS